MSNVDFIAANGQFQGDLAAKLHNNKMDPGTMRPWLDDDGRAYITCYKGGDPKSPTSYQSVPTTNATLRRDEWKQLDAAVLAASRFRLGGIDDLRTNGLVLPIGNAMGTTVFEYHDINDGMTANVSMDGVTRGQGDRVVYGTNYIPLPIIHVDFEINLRVLEVSRRNGTALDTSSIEMATRRCYEKLEAMLFTATTYAFGGGTIYSYLNQTYRNQVTLAKNWDASGTTGAEILENVLDMKQASINDYHYGPWMLYIPTAYETVLDDDFGSSYPKTIRQRILEVSGIKGIKVVDTLTANNVLLVQMTSDVVRLLDGMAFQAIEWDTEGKWVKKFKIAGIQVPQIRSDQNNKSGVVHLAA